MAKKQLELSQYDEIERLYVEEGLSQSQIAKRFPLTQQGVGKVLARREVKSRKYKSDAKRVFKKITTEEAAYWLGFFAADGNVSGSTVQIELQNCDVSHLKRFKKFVGAGTLVQQEKTTWYGFKSVQFVEDLAKWGIKERKSMTYDPIIPQGHEKAFWRGMIDGDGSLINKEYTSVNLSGTKEAVTAFKKFLTSHDIVSGAVFSYGTWHTVECWGYQAKRAMSVLYEGANVALERKKKIAMAKMITENQEGCVHIGQGIAKGFMKKYHYLKTLPVASVCYGWFDKGELIGVAAVGSPTSRSVAQLYDGKAIELRRFALSRNEKNLGSKFLGAVIRRLKEKYDDKDVLVSYADRAQGHEGIIYKAVGARVEHKGKEQIIGRVGDRVLSGMHLQKYIAEHGGDEVELDTAPGKVRYVIDL